MVNLAIKALLISSTLLPSPFAFIASTFASLSLPPSSSFIASAFSDVAFAFIAFAFTFFPLTDFIALAFLVTLTAFIDFMVNLAIKALLISSTLLPSTLAATDVGKA